MTDILSNRGQSMLWIMLLTAASTITTLVLACATPFPSLAALAALYLSRRDGILLMLLAWGASQVVGLGILHYPHDVRTLAWGVALAGAGIGAVIGARATIDRIGNAVFPLKWGATYVAAFVAFKLILLLWSFGLGGAAAAFDPDILLRQFVRNGAILVGLLALYHALVAIGVPSARSGLRAT